MRPALDLLQFLLWAEGFLCLVATPALARAAWLNPSSPLISWATAYMAVVGLAAPWVAWGLSRREQWSRWAGLAHGVLQVPALPFLTPIGVVAIGVLAHPASGQYLSEKPLPRRRSRFPLWRIALQGAGLLWLVSAAWMAGEQAHFMQVAVWPPAALLLLVPLMAVVDLVIHETGHLIAGALAGLRFERFCAGPLLIRRLGDGWGVSIHPSLLLDGGFVSMVPVDPRGVRASLALLAAGGPAASLALAAAAAWGATGSPAWYQPLMILSAWALFTFAGNAWPAHTGGGATDGALFLDLVLGTPAGKRYCALAAMAASEVTELRPRDWSPAWLRQARAMGDQSPEHLTACLLEHLHALDQGDLRRAGEALEEALSLERRLPELLVSRHIHLTRAWFEAVHRRAPQRARDALEAAAAGLPVERYLLRRAEAAVLLAEEDSCCAPGALRAASESLERARASGMTAFERDRLAETLALVAGASDREAEVAGCLHHRSA